MDLPEITVNMEKRVRIDARQVSLCYPARQGASSVALNHIDFSIAAGEMTGVLGPSGSGKSSLLYVLSGLLRPTAGKVFYQDQDIAGWSPEARENYRREHAGFIFQRHYLIGHLTLLENILLPLTVIRQTDKDRAAALLERLCPGVPGGLLPGSLSVGQRQLVAIARALINQPSLIFADEPTAALDTNTAFSVMDLMAEQADKAAIIVVTHDLKILRDAGRIIKLRDGCMIS